MLSSRNDLLRTHKANRSVLIGSNLDQIYIQKDQKLRRANDDVHLQRKEIDQLKQLNLKLLDKVDYLQSVLDEQAPAKEYFFNFPSNPNEISLDDRKRKDDRVRQVYEKKMQLEARMHEGALQECKLSFSNECESLYSMISDQAQQLIALTHEHVLAQSQFKQYYNQSDLFLKQKDLDLQNILKEQDSLSKVLQRTKLELDKQVQENQALRNANQKLKAELGPLREEGQEMAKMIHKYEEKYKHIDISKLHEKVTFWESKFHTSENNRRLVEQSLNELRDKILRATHSKFPELRGLDYKPPEGEEGHEEEKEEKASEVLQFIHKEVEGSMGGRKKTKPGKALVTEDQRNDLTKADLF